ERMASVGSAGEAQMFIPFPIREPAGLGIPDLIAATPREQASPEHAAVLFRYGQTAYGPVTVIEQSGAQVVRLRGGIAGLLDVTPTGSMLRWIEGGVVFTLIAPAATRDQLLALAERV